MKKIISRNEFQKQRISNAKKLGKNRSIFKKALKIKVEANNKYYWVSLTDWFGEPCLQLTSDLFGLQEAIYKSKPDYIIEIETERFTAGRRSEVGTTERRRIGSLRNYRLPSLSTHRTLLCRYFSKKILFKPRANKKTAVDSHFEINR